MHFSKLTDPNAPSPMICFCSQCSRTEDPGAAWFRMLWRTSGRETKKLVCSLASWTIRMTAAVLDFAVSLLGILGEISSSAELR